MRPSFAGASCRNIDEGYAISYTYKRGREAYHGGIDMPAPTGTPVIAAAAGRVVGKFRGESGGRRGLEIVLQHSPGDTGIPLWIYTQYAHFNQMPGLAVGQRVRIGQVLGPTGNSGAGRDGRQSNRRRPAVHFAAFFSHGAAYGTPRGVIAPIGGQWMDPVALYRAKPPFDSTSMRALPVGEKRVPIPYMLAGGEVVPAGSKLVWPYLCRRN